MIRDGTGQPRGAASAQIGSRLLTKKAFRDWVGEMIEHACPGYGFSLDVGCGSMQYRNYYRNRVVGYDIRPTVSPDVVGAVEQVPFETSVFDFATSFQCLYYAGDAQQAACELARLLKPGAFAIVSVSGLLSLYRERCRDGIVPQLHGRRWWLKLFRHAGFSAQTILPPTRYSGAAAAAFGWTERFAGSYRFFALEKQAHPR